MSVEIKQEQLNTVAVQPVVEAPSQVEVAPIATTENGLQGTPEIPSAVLIQPIVETPKEETISPVQAVQEVVPDKVETSGDRWSRVIKSKQQGVSPVIG